ncbi:hypothetical protein B0H11DRAFT_2219526 [Mycena galericulata]|nr:hypothetical protein B0H11DRAFT_2219526 [Mycena galericulata]
MCAERAEALAAEIPPLLSAPSASPPPHRPPLLRPLHAPSLSHDLGCAESQAADMLAADSEHPFPVMDGADEGIFAWVTANYLLETVPRGREHADCV